MANVVVVLDQDPVRRARFVEKARAAIAPVAGLDIADREGDGWAAIWAAAKTAPVSITSDGSTATLVWGDAIDPAGRRLGAQEAQTRWREDDLASWDGFHLAIDVTGIGQLKASVDIMGLMPLYYWKGPDVVLVGTSVDVFRAHPAFRTDLDATGLVGIMLMNGLVGGRTLWRGVRRLGVRRQLRVRDWNPSEIETFSLPEADPSLFELPFEGHLERMGETLDLAMKRHVRSDEPHGLLLSGGMDSRQIGGFLLDRGASVKALTFGLGTDVEMKCAKAVAKALGIAHVAAEIPPSTYAGAAESLVKVEGLAAGFCNVMEWGMIPHLECLPPRLALGHVFDGVVGGIHISWAYDPACRDFTFETIFKRFNRWAFSPNQLREMLDPEWHAEIDEVLQTAKDTFESASSQPNLKAWHFDLLTRQRFHVGSAVWPMAFRSWPVSPIFDRDVFRVAAAMPASTIGERRLQRELLATRHPHLAAVPLDRNSYNDLPIRATLRDHLRVGVGMRWQKVLNRMPIDALKREGRFFYRTYDFNSPGWMNIRQMAESHRNQIPSAIRRESIDRILPRPGQALRTDDGIIDSSTSKMLVGLALAGHHFGLT